MKLKTKFFVCSSLGIASIFCSTLLTSCSNTIYQSKTKIINLKAWTGNPSQSTKNTNNNESVDDGLPKISTLETSNVSIEEALYGSKFNNGNYLFVYGTRKSDAFRTFLYGPNGDANNSSNNTEHEQNFKSSIFLGDFFDDNAIGNNLFEGNSNSINRKVEILLYSDMPDVKNDASALNGLDGINTPFDKFSQDEMIKIANDKEEQEGKYDINTLPKEYLYKIGTYKRYDNDAILYRNFIEYASKIRPNISFEQDGGIIAFKEKTAPKYFQLSTDYLSVQNYYQLGE